MSAADLRNRVMTWLGRVQVDAPRALGLATTSAGAVVGRGAERVRELSEADPRVRVAGAFATGLMLGKVVNFLGT